MQSINEQLLSGERVDSIGVLSNETFIKRLQKLDFVYKETFIELTLSNVKRF